MTRARLDFLFDGAALAGYAGLSLALFGRAGGWQDHYLGHGQDPIQTVWFMNWWVFSALHHLDPFTSGYVWFPRGFNLAWTTSVPSLALMSLPLRVLAGPLAAFNAVFVLAPALSAWTAFLLLRDLVASRRAAFVGGYLFGFSSYQVGQQMGHLNLSMTFLVPLAVLLCVRRVRGEVGRAWFVALLTILFVLQLGISTEILATLCVMGAVGWLIFLLHAPAGDRRRLLALAAEIPAAAALTVLLALPFFLALAAGLADVPPVANPPVDYSEDLLNFVVPTAVTRLGRVVFSPIASRFSGNASEQGAYLGAPLLLVCLLYFIRRGTGRYARALLVTALVASLFSLGPWLHVDGARIALPLPWLLTQDLPLIRAALPGRLSLYVALCSSAATALYLAAPASRARSLRRFALAGLACLFILPNASMFGWAAWPRQPFFSPQHVRLALGGKANVLVLPFGSAGDGLAWQIDGGMQFTQSGGYVGYTPRREASWAFLGQLAGGAPGPTFGNDLAAFCDMHGVDHVLVGPTTPAALVAALAGLGWRHSEDQGIDVIQVPPPESLRYVHIAGDYWPSADPTSWIGRNAVIRTHGTAAELTLHGVGFLHPDVTVTLSRPSQRSEYHVVAGNVTTIPLLADTETSVTSSSTFVPDQVFFHNGDTRELSLLVSLRPVPPDPPARAP